jgi:trk system potassium uptake protein
MKQFAVIGLGPFGVRMIEELSEITADIIIVDKNAELIERYKDKVRNAYISDALNEEAIRHIIPEGLNAVVVDLGDAIEASILATNYLKKMGVENIIVKANSDAHGEVLKLVGANTVIYPDREAARRITPLLVSSLLFNFMPISAGLVLAEVLLPPGLAGLTLIEANLRQRFSVNVIAIRKEQGGEYQFFTPGYKLMEDDVLLVAGKEEDVISFSGHGSLSAKRGTAQLFKSLFGKKKKR